MNVKTALWCQTQTSPHHCRTKSKKTCHQFPLNVWAELNGNPYRGSLTYQMWSVGVTLLISPITTWNNSKRANLFAELTSPHVNQVSPDTILQGHSHRIGPMPPKTVVIGFKTCKQAKAFFPPNTRMRSGAAGPWFSVVERLCKTNPIVAETFQSRPKC